MAVTALYCWLHHCFRHHWMIVATFVTAGCYFCCIFVGWLLLFCKSWFKLRHFCHRLLLLLVLLLIACCCQLIVVVNLFYYSVAVTMVWLVAAFVSPPVDCYTSVTAGWHCCFCHRWLIVAAGWFLAFAIIYYAVAVAVLRCVCCCSCRRQLLLLFLSTPVDCCCWYRRWFNFAVSATRCCCWLLPLFATSCCCYFVADVQFL